MSVDHRSDTGGHFEVPADWNQPLLDQLAEQGSGVRGDGFLRILNPVGFLPAFQRLLPAAPHTLPIAATAFGDIIFIDEGSRLFAALFRHGVIRSIDLIGIDGFTLYSTVPGILELITPTRGYAEAAERLGVPDIDECFGYSPILAIGGSEKPDNLERVQLIPHLELIVQLAGPIDRVVA